MSCAGLPSAKESNWEPSADLTDRLGRLTHLWFLHDALDLGRRAASTNVPSLPIASQCLDNARAPRHC